MFYYFLGYQAKVLSLLSCIKTQNDVLISLLKQQQSSTLKGSLKPELNLKFPTHNADELNSTIEPLLANKENYDNLVSYYTMYN